MMEDPVHPKELRIDPDTQNTLNFTSYWYKILMVQSQESLSTLAYV